ncbi:hypothetical protein GEMRC1_008007 [Eukaryota sp. GEM-RC1]
MIDSILNELKDSSDTSESGRSHPYSSKVLSSYLQECHSTIPVSCFIKNADSQDIDLSNLHLGPSSTSAILKALKHSPNLFSLNLYDNSFGSIGFKALTSLLESAPRLTKLNIGRNKLNQVFQPILLLSLNNIKSQILDGEPNYKSPHELSPFLCFSSSSVTDLNVCGNSIGDNMMPFATSALIDSKVKHLSIADNGLTKKSLDHIGNLAVGLTSLDISSNPLGSADCASILFPSIFQSKISHLNISNIGLDDDGVAILIDSFKSGKQPRLKELIVCQNRFTVDGFFGFQFFNSVLNYLDLSKNLITSVQLVEFLKPFSSSSTRLFVHNCCRVVSSELIDLVNNSSNLKI